MIRKMGWISASLAGALVVNGLLGAVVCFFRDAWFPPSWGVGAIDAVWLVLGALAGLIHLRIAGDLCARQFAGEWTPLEVYDSIGTLVVTVSTAWLAGLSGGCYWFLWRRGVASENGYYVPIGMRETLIFLGAIAGAMWVARAAARRKRSS
jgi:hypothetical protein